MDRRTRKTKKLIKETYLNLLQKKPVNKISVSEITALADLGRGTFYTHYSDIYDLHAQVIDEILKELVTVFDATYPINQRTDFYEFCQNIIQFSIENKTVLQLITTKTSEYHTLKEWKELLIAKVINAEKLCSANMKDYIEVSFALSGIISVLADWLNGVLPIESEELTTILNDIMIEY